MHCSAETVLNTALAGQPTAVERKALASALAACRRASREHDKKLGARLAAAFA
jgi:hypothetical protein